MNKLVVVALGGNALLRGEQEGTIDEQINNAKETAHNILSLIKANYNIVITHGNGPQVGNILLANTAGHKLYNIPDMPLDVAVAYSQGFIAYIIEQQMHNLLRDNNIEKDIISIITQVIVDKNDNAFNNLTKPVGPYYTKEDSEKITAENGSTFAADPRGRGYRKVVASPKPLEIRNQKTIEQLARSGQIVIAVGGGGIPAYYINDEKLKGIDAVIDKDLASSLLATSINADNFYILTDIPKVCINFNKPNQLELSKITLADAKAYLAEGHFAEGSMAPKIRAAIAFVEKTGKEAIITNAENLNNESGGTHIIFS